MQPSCGMTLIFLLVRLQWNRSNTEAGEVKGVSKGNSSVTENHQSAEQPTSQRFVLHMTTAPSPSTISHAAPAATNAEGNATKTTELITGAKSTSPRSPDGTTFSSTVSENGTNNSATNFHRSLTSSATFRTTDGFSEVTKSAAAASTSTETPSHPTVTYTTVGASVLPSENSSVNPTVLLPISATLTSPMAKQDSPTPNFNPFQQTTKLNHNSSNLSIAPPNPKDAREDKTNREGVIVGAIVGAALGSVLIGLVGYFVCAKKRSESFSHRRLYDDSRSDPVLHLDNSLQAYDMSFGGASDDKSSTADKTEEDNAGCPSEGIPMADITPSHPPF